jgi:hypothetical protein
LSTGQKIWALAGLVYFIASFLSWYSVDLGIEGFGSISRTWNAWDLGFLWGTLWALLFIIGAVLLVLPAFGVNAPKLPAVAYLAVAALATLFTLLKLIIGEDDPIKTSFGIFLALVAAIVAVYGGFMMFKESGGTLDDLKDMNKLKGSFQGSGGSSSGAAPPPPPPPSGMAPPPPPPPA